MSAVAKAIEPVLLRDDADGIATVTLNRGQQFNLLTSEMIDALQSAFDAIARDESVRVVVIAAAGKGFCAGHDLKEIRALGAQPKIEQLFARCSRMMVTMTRLPQPVIARVQGAAAAAGCQLVAQCDLAVAADTTRFTAPGVSWGFFCSTPGVALARNLPRKRALEMLLTGDMIDATTALQWGLVNRVVPADQLDAEVRSLAQKIAAKPRATVADGKRAFYQQVESGLERAYELAGHTIATSFAHEEGREGMDAFIDKRAPRWAR
jgi:enoyl-CoA hydratase/carnithine racemase